MFWVKDSQVKILGDKSHCFLYVQCKFQLFFFFQYLAELLFDCSFGCILHNRNTGIIIHDLILCNFIKKSAMMSEVIAVT
jgi:hypothetical protein